MADQQSYLPPPLRDDDDRAAHVPPPAAPGKFQAIGIMLVVSGSVNLAMMVFWAVYTLLLGLATFGIGLLLCVVPLMMAVTGALELTEGIRHLRGRAGVRPPKAVAILEICAIISCSVWSMVCGILILVFVEDPEVKAHYDRLR